jgi:threonine synthase
MTGVQSISYELAEQLPAGIDHVFCPAGGGGLTLAVARGFALLVSQGRLPSSPAIHCVQPEGNNTIAGPLRDGLNNAQAVVCESQISGLQVPNVIDGDAAIAACRASGGTGHLIPDEVIWSLQSRLAQEEGIFCEPAGATALAGALQAIQNKEIQRDATIACLVTGSAFKDPASLDRMVSTRPCPTIEFDALAEWLLPHEGLQG